MGPLMVTFFLLSALQLKVDADFPGGSVRVEKIDQEARLVRFQPAAYEGRGWVCWWYFKLTGITPGETITLDVGGGGFARPDQATLSTDGKTWKHTAPAERRGNRNIYRQVVKTREAWFAWGPPFLLKDARALVLRLAESSAEAEAIELCRSAEKRSVPMLRVGPDVADRPTVWIHARQHAWESGSSWVARGLGEWLVSDDERARSLRLLGPPRVRSAYSCCPYNLLAPIHLTLIYLSVC